MSGISVRHISRGAAGSCRVFIRGRDGELLAVVVLKLTAVSFVMLAVHCFVCLLACLLSMANINVRRLQIFQSL